MGYDKTTTYQNLGPDLKVGDLVMFAGRAQTSGSGMLVTKVDTNMFNTLIEVDGKWWTPGCFMPYEEWRNRHFRK